MNPGVGLKREYEDPYGAQPMKRQRTESRVVFVRGLPPDCLESELLALCCPFAVVEKCLLIPPKRSAFVQLPDVASATNLISFYQSRDAIIRGSKITFEFSNRDEISVRPEFDNQYGGQPMHAPHMQHQQQQQQPMSYAPQQLHQPAPYRQSGVLHDAPPPTRRGIGAPNAILMVSVSNIQYDVTVDVLQQVFQKFGNVQKVVCFWKNEEFKSLVQMETVEQAAAAQSALDGRDIYTGCNTLSIVFSKHDELRVRFNGDHSRDFTNPNLPSAGARESDNASSGYQDNDRRDYDRAPSGRSDYGSDPRGSGPDPVSKYGTRERGDSFQSDSRDRRPLSPRYDNARDRPRDSRPLSGGVPVRDTGRTMRNDIPPSPVLICSNMDRALATPDRIFTFFGCFGDVLRVKIMFRKQDTALIQFASEEHATSALEHADSLVLFGRKLRVDYSKHTSVSMPRGDVDRFELENTVDFTNSPHHRYRRRSLQEAVTPCPLLHVSCIPQELQRNESALVDLFARQGLVKSFQYLRDPKMALVEMANVDDAVMCVLTLHNLPYADSNLRVSFSNAFNVYSTRGGGAGPGGPRDRPRDRSRDRGGMDRGVRDRSRERGRPMVGGDRPPMRERSRGGRDRGRF